MKPIRNSAKALLIHERRLLVTRNVSQFNETYYLLPGGGQEPGETLEAALRREVLEETGLLVRVGALRYVRDYIGRNHEFHFLHPDVHALEFMFLCELEGPPQLPQPGSAPASNPDRDQTGVEWLPLEELARVRFFPKALKAQLDPAGDWKGPVYLGDTN